MAAGITSCRDASVTPAGPFTTQPARVVAWTLPISSFGAMAQVAGDWMVYTVDSSVVAVDPATGLEAWRTTFRPPMVGIQSVGNVVRVAESVGGTFNRVTFIDAGSGRRLFTSPDANEWTRQLIATTDSDLMFMASNDAVLLRDRSSGATRWSSAIPLPPCLSTQPVPCYVMAGRTGGDWVLVRFNPGRSTHHLMRVSGNGAISVAPFTTPASDTLGTRLASVTLDASGMQVFLTASGITMALDARTGVERWRAVFSPQSRWFLSTTVLAHYVSGSDPSQVHAIYADFVTSVVMREIVVRLADGEILRERPFSADSRFERVQPCGSEGLVLLFGGPGFTYTDSRSGRLASAVVVDAGGTNVALDSQVGVVLTWPSGRMVVQPTNAARLVGFKCALATP